MDVNRVSRKALVLQMKGKNLNDNPQHNGSFK